MKRNILRNLVAAGAAVTVVPATATFDEIMAHEPAGIFLSNGPGDPAATGVYAVPTIQAVLNAGVPLFGICLGHQLLGLAVGASTYKMHQGHRGANHPVKRLDDGRVEITSMNHGFAVDTATLPGNARVTHVSLFDGSLAGLELTDRPAFSVQYHPEASPGPQDSHYLFERFVDGIAMTGTSHLSPPGRGRETPRSGGPGEGGLARQVEVASEGSCPSPQPSPRRGEEAAARPDGAGAIQLERAKAMRSAMTPPEAVVWKMLRAKRLNGHKFARQVPVGPYIVDFAARRAKLIVELDGRSHDATVAYDTRREAALIALGYRVLRFTNGDVATNPDGIARAIDHALGAGSH